MRAPSTRCETMMRPSSRRSMRASTRYAPRITGKKRFFSKQREVRRDTTATANLLLPSNNEGRRAIRGPGASYFPAGRLGGWEGYEVESCVLERAYRSFLVRGSVEGLVGTKALLQRLSALVRVDSRCGAPAGSGLADLRAHGGADRAAGTGGVPCTAGRSSNYCHGSTPMHGSHAAWPSRWRGCARSPRSCMSRGTSSSTGRRSRIWTAVTSSASWGRWTSIGSR